MLWHEANDGWNFQVGVTAGRLDPERLKQAFDAAMACHPLTRCCVEGEARFHWASDGHATIGPIAVVECADDNAVQDVALTQLEQPIDLRRAPLMRAVIARTTDHDVLSTGFSHVLADGFGSLRFLRSVARAYRGEPDPPPAADIAAAHAALVDPRAADWSALTRKWSTRLELAADAATPRSRLAPSGGRAGAGAGAITRAIPAAPALEASRRHAGSFGTYAMAALHVTVEDWNRAHGQACEYVGVSQAVNLRPPEWWDDVVVSLAAMTSVLSRPGDRVDVATAIARIGSHLEIEKQRARARALVATSAAGRVVPFALRRQALAAAARQQFDTCMLSNLRSVPDPPRFSDDVQPVISVTTAAMPSLPVGLAMYTAFDELRFMVMYRRECFDEAGVNAFVDAYAERLSCG